MKRTAQAIWKGSVKEGKGSLTTQSNVLRDQDYSYKTRFGDAKGTNPDELLAAAHAGCFVMALSLILGESGFTPDSLEATCNLTMDTENLELTTSHLVLKARIPEISEDEFLECARKAKENCPVSKALQLEISMDAELIS